MRSLKQFLGFNDSFGFRFWLTWILLFAGSFIVAAILWTSLLRILFGRIEEVELTFTWAVAVFGSWFLLVIPFMRKKEQIWKRLNEDQESAVDAWLGAMAVLIGFLIASSLFWTWLLRDRILSTPSGHWDLVWAKAVFTTWLFSLIPFSIWMYRKADQIFKTAVIRQSSPQFKKAAIEKSKRLLPDPISRKLHAIPPTLREGHVITAILKDGRKIPHVFVLNSKEILWVYDRTELDFTASDVVDIEATSAHDLPPYEDSKWLRLDLM